MKQICKFNIDNGPWIAGGCVRKLWEGVEWINEDVDIFFSNLKSFDSVIHSFEEKYKRKYDVDEPVSIISFFKNDLIPSISPKSKVKYYPVIEDMHNTDNAASYRLSGFNKIVGSDKSINLQFISRTFPNSILDLFSDFDWTVCQFVSDGETMWAPPNAIRDLELRKLELIPETTRPITFNRVVKYISYGFDPTDEIMLKMMEFLTTGIELGVEDDYK